MPTKTYRIAMVAACPFPCQRGTPVRIHRLAEGLLSLGHGVHVVTYHLGDHVALHPELHLHRIANVPTYHKKEPGPTLQKLLIVDTMLARRLRAMLNDQRFDIVHAHHFEGLLVALAALRGRPRVPLVFDAHTLLHSELPYYAVKPLRSMAEVVGGWIDQQLPRRADYVVAVTDSIRDHLLQLGVTTPETSATVGNGVEHERFEHYVRKSRMADDDCFFVFTGNLARYQGIESMLHAFARLRARRTNVRLRVISQSSFERYERLTGQLGIKDAIELIPADFEVVPRWLAASDIALNPRIEAPGLPQKTVNYMAAGKAIVSFASSGHHLDHGKTALLVADGDIDAFARAMERLVDEPALALHLGEAARAVALGKMSWKRAAALVGGVYDATMRLTKR